MRSVTGLEVVGIARHRREMEIVENNEMSGYNKGKDS